MLKDTAHRTKRTLIIAAIAAVLLLVLACDSRLIVRRYDVNATGIVTPIRIALVTDLHSCYYGKEQTKLIRAIDAQSPDIILLGGDIFDDKMDDTNTESFLAGISRKYPCYYVTGNHEYWSEADAFGHPLLCMSYEEHPAILAILHAI